ncbi:hypothetical protein XO10_00210 [Marinitoga sp. 1135]|uniref:IGHMBP2 family helicase n=1 Tax=unclassified Marinitoga TaxID=2640159 RepID=UPI000950A7A5|nr:MULTISPECIES: IGHMBP2 family helicase [unclassified Marinitoga]APT74995.1 hypothetical protein LN42_00210 [Marinitoga sp. 1137]NUU94751.1 hypothetical protein [Marinitoga sp. 1135]
MNFFEKLYEAIELEKEAEIQAMKNEIKLYKKEREKMGRAITGLSGKYLGREIGNLYIVKFGRKKDIKTEISSGDIVLVSKGDPLKSDLTATVTEVGKKYIIVSFSEKIPVWVYKSKNIRLDLFLNEITFKRMQKAILKMNYAENELKILKNIFTGKYKPTPIKKEKIKFFDNSLNKSQKEAVEKAIGSKEIFLIHGPPGTGKTRTLTEIIVQEAKKEKKVLVTADSNAATDNILGNLIKYETFKICRLGHPGRVDEDLKKHSLYYIAENHEEYKEIVKIRDEAMQLSEKRDKTGIKPTPQNRRGLTDEQIEKYALKDRGTRGIFPDVMKKMYEWIKINNEVQKLFDKAREMEEELIKKIIEEYQIIVSTNSTSGIDELENITFDVVVIDEASQSTEPSCYIAITHGKKVIMGGDHRQLPPTILNKDVENILSKTLFERMINKYPSHSAILKVQYRMNDKIMQFSNQKFYNGILRSADNVYNQTLTLDLSEVNDEKTKEILDTTPIVFVDTSSNPERFEIYKKGSKSKYNPLEAKIVIELATILKEQNVDFGIITPYKDQMKYLKEKTDFYVNTVDGFQGRENDVIILSLTRSNDEGTIGFLKDERRLNVAITRARKKLIIIGDISTLKNYPLFDELINYISLHGKIISI